jgi:hypothetical protein
MIPMTDVPTDENVDTIVWSFIELTCIIVCGSLPALRPWFTQIIPSITKITGNSRKYKSSKGGSEAQEPQTSELVEISMPQKSRRKDGGSGLYDRMEDDKMYNDEFPLKPTSSDGPLTRNPV